MPSSSPKPPFDTPQSLRRTKNGAGSRSTNTLNSNSDSSVIKVICRLRPMNAAEKLHGTLPVIKASTQDRSVTVIKGQGSRQVRSSFTFDNVFTAFSTQEEVFESTMRPVIRDVMKGFESTVFAYGQTGTGKTFTMEGDLDDDEMQGIIPRSSNAIFDTLKFPNYIESKVTCSYLEIYNEELSDLLVDEKLEERRTVQKLDIMETKNGGPVCRGLIQKEVKSSQDVLNLMVQAQNKRRIGETKMNRQSSRSHCVFTIRVRGKARDNEGTLDFDGKLHLVDLAGSECAKTASLDVKSAEDDGSRERERMNINRSLLTLGRVLTLLEKQNTSKKSANIRIPYRDSKLTRILQESLGGKCKTLVIATLSPSLSALEESISTLNYAQSASGIVNKPVSVSYMSTQPLPNMNDDKVSSLDNSYSIEYWEDMQCRLQYMQAQVDEAQAALARKHLAQQEIVDKLEAAEADKILAEDNLVLANEKMKIMQDEMDDAIKKRQEMHDQLEQTKEAHNRTIAILKATQHTEKKLTEEARTLIQTLKNSILDGNELHGSIRRNQKIEVKRRNATKDFQNTANEMLDKSLSLLSNLTSKSKQILKQVSEVTIDNSELEASGLKEISSTVHSISEEVKEQMQHLSKQLNDSNGIIALSSNCTSNATSEIDEITNIVNKSDTLLAETCETGQQQLEKSSKHLYHLHELHSEKVSNSLQSLETNISSSKSKISNMIASALDALTEAREDQEALRSAHNDLLGEWRESSLRNTKEVKGTAISESENVKKSLEKFEGEMKHIDEIESILDHQRDLVKNEGLSHISQVTEQKGDLVTQSEMIESANARRVQAQELFINNVMESFQSLIRTQFQKLTDENERSHVELRTSNDGLQERNKSLGLGAQGIVEKVDKSSETLIMHTKLVRENDNNASVSMKQAKERLDFVADKTGQHQEMIKDYARRADDNMTSLATLDSTSDKICKSIEDDGEQCSDYLSNTLLKETSTNFEELAQGADNMVNHCKDNLISDCSSTLNEILKPRNEVIESINNRAHNITTTLSTGKKKIEEIATTLHSKGEETAAFVLDCDKTLNNKVLKRRHEQILATKEKVALHIAKLSDVTSLNVTNSSVQTKAVKSQIEGFATNVMHSNEEVPPIEKRNEFDFTEELSSTPAEDIILETFPNVSLCSKANDIANMNGDDINGLVGKNNVGHIEIINSC